MIIRKMTIEDVPKLILDEPWVYDRFRDYFLCNMGPAYIAEENGIDICAFGAVFEWGPGGACEVWFNVLSKKRIFTAVKILKRQMINMAFAYKVTRMQAIVKCGNKINNRFMKFMGFVNETPFGMKNKLFNGETAYLYSRCF